MGNLFLDLRQGRWARGCLRFQLTRHCCIIYEETSPVLWRKHCKLEESIGNDASQISKHHLQFWKPHLNNYTIHFFVKKESPSFESASPVSVKTFQYGKPYTIFNLFGSIRLPALKLLLFDAGKRSQKRFPRYINDGLVAHLKFDVYWMVM